MTRPRICTSDKSPKSQLCEWRGETKSYSVHLCSAPNVPRGPLGWQSAVETQAMKVWNFACGCMYVTSKIGFLRIRRFRSFCGKLAEDRVRRAGTFRLPTLRIREVVGPFRKLLRLPRRRAWRSVESASVLTAPAAPRCIIQTRAPKESGSQFVALDQNQTNLIDSYLINIPLFICTLSPTLQSISAK